MITGIPENLYRAAAIPPEPGKMITAKMITGLEQME